MDEDIKVRQRAASWLTELLYNNYTEQEEKDNIESLKNALRDTFNDVLKKTAEKEKGKGDQLTLVNNFFNSVIETMALQLSRAQLATGITSTFMTTPESIKKIKQQTLALLESIESKPVESQHAGPRDEFGKKEQTIKFKHMFDELEGSQKQIDKFISDLSAAKNLSDKNIASVFKKNFLKPDSYANHLLKIMNMGFALNEDFQSPDVKPFADSLIESVKKFIVTVYREALEPLYK